MTDQIFYEELRATIRDAVASYLDTYTAEELRELATESLKPPELPTLADMTPEDRDGCQWMQADVYSFDRRMVITEVRTMCADLIERDGERWNVGLERVTPRPDLPRMEWPGDKKPAPAPAPALPDGWRLADHPGHGRGIVTTPTPNSDGRVCFAIPSGSPLGYSWHLCYPYELTYIDTDQGACTSDPVPPNTLTKGSEWDNVDALARACKESGRDQIVVLDHAGGAYVWDEKAEWWEGSAPPQYDPFTILHIGLGSGQ